jgi:hypothetical protein
MQLIDLIAIDPERHTPSRMRCLIQVHFCFAESKGDRAGIEENKSDNLMSAAHQLSDIHS